MDHDLLTARTSISLASWLSSFLMESSVPGTTVRIREVPGVSAGPTARLCKKEEHKSETSHPALNQLVLNLQPAFSSRHRK